jgi:hypothetical protein
MTSAIVVLLLVAGLVTLSIVRPGRPALFPATPADRDQERQLAELRALPGYRPDLDTRPRHSTWKAASRPASAATSRSAAPVSGWNGAHRTSPSM